MTAYPDGERPHDWKSLRTAWGNVRVACNRVTRRNRERPQENVTGELGVLVEPNLKMERELLVLLEGT